jgi:hypothetical protein
MAERMEQNRSLEALAADLKKEAATMADYDEKHLKWTFYIKVGLALFIAVYLGVLYVNLKPVNAQFLVFMAQERMTEALPEAKKSMADRLTRMAPGVINQVADEIMKNIPTLGQRVEKGTQAAVIRLGDQVEADLAGWMSEFIKEKKKVVDEMFPNMTSYEKITALRQYVIEDSREALKGVGTEVGENLKDHELTMGLRRLAYASDLTAKEKLQREVIALMYVLVQRDVEASMP